MSDAGYDARDGLGPPPWRLKELWYEFKNEREITTHGSASVSKTTVNAIFQASALPTKQDSSPEMFAIGRSPFAAMMRLKLSSSTQASNAANGRRTTGLPSHTSLIPTTQFNHSSILTFGQPSLSKYTKLGAMARCHYDPPVS